MSLSTGKNLLQWKYLTFRAKPPNRIAFKLAPLLLVKLSGFGEEVFPTSLASPLGSLGQEQGGLWTADAVGMLGEKDSRLCVFR